MKSFITLVLLTISLYTNAQDWDTESYSETVPTIVEVSVAPIQVAKSVQKPKLVKVVPRAQLLAQQRIKQIQREENDEQEADESDIGYDEYPAHRGYGRPKLVEDSDKLSDEVKIRLMVARMRALEVYRNTWA